MAKHDGWVIKEKQGSLLFWTIAKTRRESKNKVTFWEEWRKKGNKIVKVKLVEVE